MSSPILPDDSDDRTGIPPFGSRGGFYSQLPEMDRRYPLLFARLLSAHFPDCYPDDDETVVREFVVTLTAAERQSLPTEFKAMLADETFPWDIVGYASNLHFEDEASAKAWTRRLEEIALR